MSRDSTNPTKIHNIKYNMKDARKCVFMCMSCLLSSLVTLASLMRQCCVSLARLPLSCHGSVPRDNRSRLCHRALNPAMKQSSDAMSNYLLRARCIMVAFYKHRSHCKLHPPEIQQRSLGIPPCTSALTEIKGSNVKHQTWYLLGVHQLR